MNDQRPRPSWTRRYVFWGAFTLGGAVVGLGTFLGAVVWTVTKAGGAISLPVPGEVTYDAPNMERATIWNEVQSAGRGPGGALAARPPSGIVVRVLDKASGADVPVSPAPMMWERFGTTGRLAVYQFTAPGPGKYTVRATGPACTLAITRGGAGRTFGMLLGGFCGGLVGAGLFLAGVVMLIVTGARQANASSRQRAYGPQPGP